MPVHSVWSLRSCNFLMELQLPKRPAIFSVFWAPFQNTVFFTGLRTEPESSVCGTQLKRPQSLFRRSFELWDRCLENGSQRAIFWCNFARPTLKSKIQNKKRSIQNPSPNPLNQILSWVLDCGFRISDFGLWILESRRRALPQSADLYVQQHNQAMVARSLRSILSWGLLLMSDVCIWILHQR